MSIDLKKEVKALATSLGIPDLSFTGDLAGKYKRGAPLLFKELCTLPDGCVVWATYKESGESGLRVNGPYEIYYDGASTWVLRDGSCGGLDFSHDGKENDACFDEVFGAGEMYLFKALEIDQ